MITMSATKMSELDNKTFVDMLINSEKLPRNGRDYYQSWIKDMSFKGASKQTMYVYSQTIKEFLDFVKKSPKTVTESDIMSYVEYLSSKGYSAGTILNYLIRVGVFLKYVGNKIDIYKFSPKTQYRVPEYLTEEEIQSLIDAVDTDILDFDEPDQELAIVRFKTLFSLLRDTGLRVSEACNLLKSDIDANERLLVVRRGKRGKFRTVPISMNVIKMLEKYWDMRADKLPYVFEYKGKKLDRLVVWRITKKAAHKAGIDKKTRTHGESIHPHLFRHSFATLELKRLIKSGKARMDAVLIVKEALGHSDINTTLIYLTLLGEDIRDMLGR